jgi:hypothetical protein
MHDRFGRDDYFSQVCQPPMINIAVESLSIAELVRRLFIDQKVRAYCKYRLAASQRLESIDCAAERISMKYDMPERLRRQLDGTVKRSCLYCSNAVGSTEHVLPAAFGYFRNAPMLPDRLCSNCNNNRLGVLDEQLARCGVEGFFRKYYGVVGRKEHDSVNPFMRGSAGGKRIEARTFDPVAGREVSVEIGRGQATQLCAISFIEKESRKVLHDIPLNPKMTPEELRAAYDRCKITTPCDVALASHPHEREWIDPLIQQAWPNVTFSEGTLMSNVIERPVLKFQVTERYHRAFAKLGFHYFLSQFPHFTGREACFVDIRQFIAEDIDDSQDRAISFITERKIPLLNTIANGLTPPDGWRAHVIAAEIRPGGCVAHVQMFITCDWKSPIRTIVLARSEAFTSLEAAGHLFLYHSDEKHDGYAGEAKVLRVMPI